MMMFRLLVSVLLFMTAFFGAPGLAQAQAAARERPQQSASEYRISPEDVLQISVWKNDMLSRTLPVRSDGMISLPLVNEVQAAGFTPMQLRDVLKNRLGEYLPNPEVSVIVMEMKGYVVSVLGEVKTAGRYQFTNRITVLDVLARAGGITEFASPSDIFVLRPERGGMTRIPFNYTKVVGSPGENQNIFIQPGDIVVVP
ncbi:MAG TPA: polysaccharide biosynthesis/export family protein [Gammaproteobacteria bacterium]|nr:polysaccharide biosynthesis/export family protein [Gammaproteobacteria bacterium]